MMVPVRSLLVVPLFLLACSVTPVLAQTHPPPLTPTVAEEQDYAFAAGLYRDGFYQIALEQFSLFLSKYPASIKAPDVSFYQVECQFRLGLFAPALAGYTAYGSSYPQSPYADDAEFRSAECYLKLGKTAEAIKGFKKVMDWKESELSGEAAYWTGESFLRANDPENAVKYYTLAYENYPKNTLRNYALYSIGWTYQHAGEYGKAAGSYERLIQEFPVDTLAAAAKIRIGECYYYAKDYSRAIAELQTSRSSISGLSERGDADYLIAEATYQLNKFAAAETLYATFIKEYPGHRLVREVRYALAWCLLKQQKLAGARELFDSLAAASDVIAFNSLYRRSTVELAMGDTARALASAEELIRRDGAGDLAVNAWYDIGTIQYARKDYSGAQERFEQVVTRFPKSELTGESLRMVGECLAAREQFKEAVPWFDRALAVKTLRFDSRVSAMFQTGWMLYRAKEFRPAADRFAAFVETFPQHPKAAEAAYWKGEALYQGGSYEDARGAFQAAIAAGGGQRESALYGLAWSEYKRNNFGAAIEGYERLLTEFPKTKYGFDARLRLGDSYYAQKDFVKASGSYRIVIRMNPGNPAADYAYYQLGQSSYRAGNVPEAIKAFGELIALLPKSLLADDAQYALGWINFQRKDFSEAIKEFQKTIRTYPDGDLAPRALYSLGDSYYNLRQYVAAEKSYREVLRQFPQSKYAADAITGIQYCLVAQGKESEAVQVIDEFVKENPGSTVVEDLMLRKAELLFNQRRFLEAAKEYRGFAEKFKNSKNTSVAVYGLARCYQAQNNPNEAAMTYERAASHPHASSTIKGESLLEAARISAAGKGVSRALELLARLDKEVTDPALQVRGGIARAEIVAAVGNSPEARLQYETIIRRFPAEPGTDYARLPLCRMLMASSEFDAALPLAERVSAGRTDESGAEAQYLAGKALLGKSEWKGAETAFLRVRYVFTRYEHWVARANVGIGTAYERMNDAGRAREMYQAVVKANKDSVAVSEASQRLKTLGGQ